MPNIPGSPAGRSAGDSSALVDIQSSPDERNIPIDRVGVRNVKYPINVRERDKDVQRTVGTFTLTVDLPRHFKGTHMSRFLEVLGRHSDEIGGETIPVILDELRDRLDAETAHLEVKFVLFREKSAPVTGKKGMMGYECGFKRLRRQQTRLSALPQRPGHNPMPLLKRDLQLWRPQPARLRAASHPSPAGILWLEDVIDIVEASASAPLYPVLKRPDEKFVTEQAYMNPRFVEDIVREVAIRLDAHPNVVSYQVEVENHESIHDHNAYASIRRSKV